MSIERTYTGRGGQMAFVAEVLFRGCNVAIPEVDQGLDVFVFHDEHDRTARVQVKTGTAERYKRGEGFHTQFAVGLKQLIADDQPPLFFAFVARLEDRLADLLIIPRHRLRALRVSRPSFGTKAGENVVFTVQFRDRTLCGEVDLTEFRNAWNLLPPFQAAGEGTSPAAGAG